MASELSDGDDYDDDVSSDAWETTSQGSTSDIHVGHNVTRDVSAARPPRY